MARKAWLPSRNEKANLTGSQMPGVPATSRSQRPAIRACLTRLKNTSVSTARACPGKENFWYLNCLTLAGVHLKQSSRDSRTWRKLIEDCITSTHISQKMEWVGAGVGLWNLFIPSFFKRLFIEHLLCARPCWATAVNKTYKGPSPMELPAQWKTDKKTRHKSWGNSWFQHPVVASPQARFLTCDLVSSSVVCIMGYYQD